MSNPRSIKSIIPPLLRGFSFAIIVLLLLVAYIPDFAPASYETLRRTGLIAAVPMISAVGLIGSLGWLWIDCKWKDNKGDTDVD